MTRKAILVCLLMLVAAVPSTGQQSGASVGAKPRYGTWGVDLTAMDRSVKPGDSFWHYVNGSWDKRTEIPADRTSAGVGVLLVEEAERQVRAIVEDLARDPAKVGRVGRQVGDFYASWMDEAAIEANGTAPLKPYLAKIDAIANRTDLLKLFATPGITSSRRTSASFPTPPIPPATSRPPARAGSACRTAIIYLLERREIRRDPRRLSRLYREAAAARRHRRCRGQGATASSRSRPRSPRSIGSRRASATSSRSTTR